jgi:vacuolar protein sorting-associated protein 18
VDITRSGSSGPILLGTRSGKLYEAELEPSEEYFRREERYLKELTTLPDSRSGINGILMGKFQDSISVKAQKSKYYVVCTTENRIYQFVGSLTAQFKGESIFDTFFKWNNTQDLVYQELPGELPSSMLKVHLAQQIPKSLAWLTAPGIYHADINSLKSDSRSVLDNVHIMPYVLYSLLQPCML